MAVSSETYAPRLALPNVLSEIFKPGIVSFGIYLLDGIVPDGNTQSIRYFKLAPQFFASFFVKDAAFFAILNYPPG